jgi:hypothetical protein
VPFAAAFAASAAADAEEMQFADEVGVAAALLVVALGAAALVAAAVVFCDDVVLFEEALALAFELVVAETFSALALVRAAVAGATVLVVVVVSDEPRIHVQTPFSQPQNPPLVLLAEALGLADAEAVPVAVDVVDVVELLLVVAGAVVLTVCALAEAVALGVGVLLVADALGDELDELALALAALEADCVDEHTVGKGSALLLGLAAIAGAAANATPTRATIALGTPMAVIRRRETSAWARRRWERAVTGTDHSCSVVGSVPFGPVGPEWAACSMTWVFSVYSAA